MDDKPKALPAETGYELRIRRGDDHVILGIFKLDEEGGRWLSRFRLTPSAARGVAADLTRIADLIEPEDG